MSSRSVDFVVGSLSVERKKPVDFNICYAYPRIEEDIGVESIVQWHHVDPRTPITEEESLNGGLCVAPDGPLTSSIVKPYYLESLRKIVVESTPKPCRKLLEIGVREVKIYQSFNGSQAPIEISAVSIFFKDKLVCKSSSPFNRKLYKVLYKDNFESNNFSITVHSREGTCSKLPLPLPETCVKNKKTKIDFSILDGIGRIHSGTVTCTLSLSTKESEPEEASTHSETTLDNVQELQRSPSSQPRKNQSNEPVDYFFLIDPALVFETASEEIGVIKKNEDILKPPDVVVSEQLNLSIVSLSLSKWFQARRPLRPSSGTNTHKLRTGREEILTITVLRGVEVPVREESALVQPLVQIHWGAVSKSTSIADGPAPVWQQTIEFAVSRQSNEQFVKLSLFDQHPIWGSQWLGEATIPLEFHRNYQEFERWIGLSPLSSPILRFGYVQASPVRSYTRIYILMKMERPGNLVKSADTNSSDVLAKSIQRCMAVPYKIPGIESPEDCAKLTMLLNRLPSHYGPLPPKQALKLNKIDDYGRSALLATLLQGLGLDAYVLIGSSQARKWATFVVSFDDKGTSPLLWDPENGENYDFGDSRCSLIKSSRIINHQNIWKNMQKSTVVPFNLRFNPKSNKDWQPLPNASSSSSASTVTREIQILEMSEPTSENEDLNLEIERHLREKLSEWRVDLALTTIFNRHAMTLLRNYLGKFDNRADNQPDKKELRQLYRAYHMHGFILNLRRETPTELADRLLSTRIHAVTGPVEFAIVCRIQKHIAKTCSVWLAVIVLRNRD
ncbi:uncharacterized protein Cc2d2a [Venturia canescens]|uniref:uncharacterized protein Cc2d2a n=1 Tax=Venturia canescens TaxID=32260 RepID=UPI001C9CBC4B|nr:uncharacterized protein LOC122406763 [Venturia canescens]XP_043268386.1 uncharacterized protein LOC122406763 [Venturia canescens]XP_043268387.1 uncharacterized protein LOC122406763 [Venturia canescens]